MKAIPLNNKTMRFSFEAFNEAIKYYEEKARRQELIDKLVTPLERKCDKLRKEEIVKLKENEKFIDYCNKIIKKDHKITEQLYEQWFDPYGSCAGEWKQIDLINKFGSKEYKEELKRLKEEIYKNKHDIDNGIIK